MEQPVSLITPGTLSVPLFTPPLLPQHLSVDFCSSLTSWPIRGRITRSVPDTVPRWLWDVCNELSGEKRSTLTHQHSSLLHVSASLSSYFLCISCWATTFSWNWKVPRGVNSSSVERYIICQGFATCEFQLMYLFISLGHPLVQRTGHWSVVLCWKLLGVG